MNHLDLAPLSFCHQFFQRSFDHTVIEEMTSSPDTPLASMAIYFIYYSMRQVAQSEFFKSLRGCRRRPAF